MDIRRPAHAVTIKDIAADLKMSHSTVSRALNGRSHINEDTKRRVHEAAERLGYVPNLSARMIRGDATLLVGLVVPDVQIDFYSRITREIAARCRDAGLRLLLASTDDDPETERQEIRALLEARVSGIVATLTSEPLAATLAMIREVPTVQLIRRTAKLLAPAVCMADAAACCKATDHLLKLGHVNIAYVGVSKPISSGRNRLSGFLRAHDLAGLARPRQGIELVPPRQEFGYDATARVLALPDRPTAIILGGAELTIGGLRAIRDAGLKVPDDISILGYGDPVWFDLLTPRLSSVTLPAQELAAAAVKQLFAQLRPTDDPAPASARVRTIAPTLLLRASTAPPPALPRQLAHPGAERRGRKSQ